MSEETASEDPFRDYKCPYCGNVVSFPAGTGGSIQECVECSEAMVVPVSGDVCGRIPLPIKTGRFALRKFQISDWKELARLLSNDQFLNEIPLNIQTEEQITFWLEQDAEVTLTTADVPFWLAVQKLEKDELIGFLFFRFIAASRQQAEFQLFLHPDYREQGFGTEVVNGLLGFCFKGIYLHRVTLQCDSANVAARKLCEEARMRLEGEFVKDHMTGEEWANSVRYAILEEEFKSAAP